MKNETSLHQQNREKEEHPSYLYYLIFPIVVGLIVGLIGGFFGKLWWDEFNRPLIEVKVISISDFDLEPDFFESLKNYPIKIELRNIGRRTAEGINVQLKFSHDILDITKIKTTVGIDSWSIKTATQQLEAVPVNNEYFTINDINEQRFKDITFGFKKLRAGESFQSIIFTEQPANLEECRFLIENTKGGSCMSKEKTNGLSKLMIAGIVSVIVLLLCTIITIGRKKMQMKEAYWNVMEMKERIMEMEKRLNKDDGRPFLH